MLQDSQTVVGSAANQLGWILKHTKAHEESWHGCCMQDSNPGPVDLWAQEPPGNNQNNLETKTFL